MARRVGRIGLGLALILHGLANAVLPLRGADHLAPGVWSPIVIALTVSRSPSWRPALRIWA